MPQIDLSILNQRQTPAFYADVLANRPAAGFIGRIFVSTNTFEFYRDNGTGWNLIGGPGAGTVTGSGAAGQVTYWNGASTVTGDNGLFYDAVNDCLGIGTITPGAAIDAHSTQNIVLQLNQTTATNNTKIAFQNSGTALWRIGNNFGGGTNSFVITDAALNINRFSVLRTSGQTFVGDVVTSSGLFVVNSSSSDAHIVALGATAPSIRVRNAGVGASLQIGLGLATTTNNFIQGATGGEFCIFNDSLTAQPILFGIKDAGSGNTLEAARISAARNFLIGTTTDAGQKLQVTGTGIISSTLDIGSTTTYQRIANNSITAFSSGNYNNTLNFGTTSGRMTLTNNSTGNLSFEFNTGSLKINNIQSGGVAGVTFSQLVIQGNLFGISTVNPAITNQVYTTSGSGITVQRLNLYNGDSGKIEMQPTGGNVLIGTTTDAGYKLDVNGTARIIGSIFGNAGLQIQTNLGAAGGISFNGSAVTSNQIIVSGGFTISSTTSYSSTSGGAINISSAVINSTSGTPSLLAVGAQFAVSSGTANFVANSVQPTWNLTGTYSGIIRGYYYNPSLTSLTGVVSHRAFENTVGDVCLGTTSGNLLIGTATSGASKLRIVGLPTSAAGLSSGDVYSNLGVLTIVP
jgi:hypothetical protein